MFVSYSFNLFCNVQKYYFILCKFYVSDGEVDSFLGQDDPSHSLPFSAVIKRPNRPNPQQSLHHSPSFSPTSGIQPSPPSNLLQNQPAIFYSPLVSGSICTPIVTTHSTSGTENTNVSFNSPLAQFSHVPSLFNQTYPSNINVSSSLLHSNNQNNNFSANPLPTLQFFDAPQTSSSTGFSQSFTDSYKPETVYQNFPGSHSVTSSIFQPISAPPVSSTKTYQPVSSAFQTVSASPVSQINSSVIEGNSSNSIVDPLPSFYSSASTHSSIQSNTDPHSVLQTTLFQPQPSSLSQSTNTSDNNNQSFASAFSDLKLNPAPPLSTFQSTSAIYNNTINCTSISSVPTYSPSLYQQPANVSSPPQFTSSNPSEGNNIVSATLAASSSAPPKGGKIYLKHFFVFLLNMFMFNNN